MGNFEKIFFWSYWKPYLIYSLKFRYKKRLKNGWIYDRIFNEDFQFVLWYLAKNFTKLFALKEFYFQCWETKGKKIGLKLKLVKFITRIIVQFFWTFVSLFFANTRDFADDNSANDSEPSFAANYISNLLSICRLVFLESA